jgi:hypothetical protein
MFKNANALLASAMLVVAVGGSQAIAADTDARPANNGQKWLDAVGAKVGLSDRQKEEIRTIRTDSKTMKEPLERQLWTLHHEEFQALRNVFTDEQRAKLRDARRAKRDKAFERIAAKLGLNDEQKKQIQKIREEYEPRRRQIYAEKDGNAWARSRKLRHEEFAAVRGQLTEEQRARLPGALREVYHGRRNAMARRANFKGLAEQLALSTDQKERVREIRADFDQKTRPLASQLRQFFHEEHEAVAKVLTDEQRAKLHEMMRGSPTRVRDAEENR